MYEINEDLAEETGIHIGDGSMNIYNGVHAYTIACHHIDDRRYMDEVVVPLYKKVYDVNPKTRNWSKGSYGFRICRRKIIEFKRDVLNLPLGKKENIKIPQQILEKNNFKKAFLRGFVSTDGSVNTFLLNKKTIYPRINLSNISKDLMGQINQILKEFGFRTTIWCDKGKLPNWRDCSKLAINGFEMLKKWNKEIGFNNPKQTKKVKELLINR